MPKIIITHEVDNVEHWLTSTKRQEVFAGIARNIETFVHPTEANKTGVTMEVDDMDALGAMLQSDVGAAAMKYDGVRPETVTMLLGTHKLGGNANE